MQQSNLSSYSFSATGKEKKIKQEQKPQARRKHISYIDTKYADKPGSSSREEMDKDLVF